MTNIAEGQRNGAAGYVVVDNVGSVAAGVVFSSLAEAKAYADFWNYDAESTAVDGAYRVVKIVEVEQ